MLIQVSGHTLLVSGYFDKRLERNQNLECDFPLISAALSLTNPLRPLKRDVSFAPTCPPPPSPQMRVEGTVLLSATCRHPPSPPLLSRVVFLRSFSYNIYTCRVQLLVFNKCILFHILYTIQTIIQPYHTPYHTVADSALQY